MTHRLLLPALDGRDHLGFLAALGVLRLLTEHTDADVRLSFDETTATAILHGPYRTCEEVAEQLTTIVKTTMDSGSVIPGVPAEFPDRKSGTKGSDPMRVLRDEYPKLVAKARAHGEEAVRWLSCLLTDLAHDERGRVALTPYSAPSGQQTVRSFFATPIELVGKTPTYLLDALTRWQRVPGVTGEYLDHRVKYDAADHPRGATGGERGVPGATWLAIMVLPLLRLSGDGTTACATLWRSLPGRRQRIMVWPLWRQPLDLAGIVALIEHPALIPRVEDGRVAVSRRASTALGVIAVSGAARRPIEGRKSAGVLAPVPVTLAD